MNNCIKYEYRFSIFCIMLFNYNFICNFIIIYLDLIKSVTFSYLKYEKNCNYEKPWLDLARIFMKDESLTFVPGSPNVTGLFT